MVASTWLRAAHRGVPIFLVHGPPAGPVPWRWPKTPRSVRELVAALRQLDPLERTRRRQRRALLPSRPGERYHSITHGCWLDLARMRAGLQAHLSPSRAQPRDPSGTGRRLPPPSRADSPSPPTTAGGQAMNGRSLGLSGRQLHHAFRDGSRPDGRRRFAVLLVLGASGPSETASRGVGRAPPDQRQPTWASASASSRSVPRPILPLLS